MLTSEMQNYKGAQRFIDLKKKLKRDRELAYVKMETNKKKNKDRRKTTGSLNFKIKLRMNSRNVDQTELNRDNNMASISENIPKFLENEPKK
ncbi:hypothetical protein NQ314_016850 [Rhamnusium bicolor]|uniref:Uncharacterized protein n=1 Tax=Rhamnusium bicolor TaxID=1586634 RepID=A0AAV8WUN5_9CUCU|nr:hypothetical protein NQ314_016850 [Rhamnusium bicolor]